MLADFTLAYCAVQVVITLKDPMLNLSAIWICHLQLFPFLDDSEKPLTVHYLQCLNQAVFEVFFPGSCT